jgi:hypothetical protein
MCGIDGELKQTVRLSWVRAGWSRRSFKAGDEVTIILCPPKNGAPGGLNGQRGSRNKGHFCRRSGTGLHGQDGQ